MALLIAIGSLTAGVIIGVVATYRFSNTSPVKVRQLEQQIEDLQQTHKAYRENVSDHFSTTAELVQQMTESYKDVYRHLASGAQTLCDHEVADKMLPAGERDKLFQEEESENTATREEAPTNNPEEGQPEAPRDYADRESGGGALSEDYGLGKSEAATDSDTAATAESAQTDPDKRDSAADEQSSTNDSGNDDGVTDKNEAAHSSADWQPTADAGDSPREEDPLAPYRKPETGNATADDKTDKATADEDVNNSTRDEEHERSQKG
ncbi:MAG: ZapG family protein [Pseudomonadota bacterium]